ncbi:MAG: type II toxin-antitoxin system RelE/ParE family toxin [Coriobacteriia bacterium]|nr:type II toxin-antitoxin system RelE/ParE family toxin [Coriobacteriia bacterium]
MEPKFDLRILTSAQYDLERIALLHFSYVGPESARKITNALYDAMEHLCRFPDMGVVLPDKSLQSLGYRGLIVGHYLCVYRHIETTVFVYRVFNARSDYPQLWRTLPKGK